MPPEALRNRFDIRNFEAGNDGTYILKNGCRIWYPLVQGTSWLRRRILVYESTE